jgi:hypothetical protein
LHCCLQALLLHNKAIQEAAYSNAGHVLAQEGDAFILGFAEPLDAAIFAIQVRCSSWHTPNTQQGDCCVVMAMQCKHIAALLHLCRPHQLQSANSCKANTRRHWSEAAAAR